MILLTLSDGPAEGHYETQRAPLFLRAVAPTRGKKDVLDLLDDVPRQGERVSVYRRTNSAAASMFICRSGRGGSSSVITGTAEYEHLAGVDGEGLRDNDTWRRWVQDQVDAGATDPAGGVVVMPALNETGAAAP